MFVLSDHFKDIASFKALGDNTEGISKLVKKGVLVGEDVGVVDAGQDSDFIEAVGDLFLGEVHDAHLLHGVFLIVLLALDPVYG